MIRAVLIALAIAALAAPGAAFAGRLGLLGAGSWPGASGGGSVTLYDVDGTGTLFDYDGSGDVYQTQ